jgi:hypothetical protein
MMEAAQVTSKNTAQYLPVIAAPEHTVLADSLAASQTVFAAACGAAVAAFNNAAYMMAGSLEEYEGAE